MSRLQDAFMALTEKLEEKMLPYTEEHAECRIRVTRSDYTSVLEEVEREFSIEQGDEDYLEWVLTLIGRSPKIIEDGEEVE